MAKYDELLATELQEGEQIIKQEAGDCWEYLGIFGTQKSGCYFLTNKRIIFYYLFNKRFEINYSDIKSIELCNVGPLIRFVPCGIKITTKDDNTYYMSVMKRKDYMELIQSNMAK